MGCRRQFYAPVNENPRPPPNPAHGGELRELKVIFTWLWSPGRRKERTNSRSSPTRPRNNRRLHYPLISGFFFAPHGNFAYITFFPLRFHWKPFSDHLFVRKWFYQSSLSFNFKPQCTSREFCLTKFPVHGKVICKEHYIMILFLSRFINLTWHCSRGQGHWTKNISPEGGLFSLFHRLQIPIPRYDPGWGRGQGFPLTGALDSLWVCLFRKIRKLTFKARNGFF